MAASAYQMLKTSRLVFVWAVSAVFVVVGVSEKKLLTREQTWKRRLGLLVTIMGVLLVSWGIVRLEAACKAKRSGVLDVEQPMVIGGTDREQTGAPEIGAIFVGTVTDGGVIDGTTSHETGAQHHQSVDTAFFSAPNDPNTEHSSAPHRHLVFTGVVHPDPSSPTSRTVPVVHEEQSVPLILDLSAPVGTSTTPTQETHCDSTTANELLNKEKTEEVLLGIALITAGVFCSALRLALQEAFLKRAKHIPPILGVGVEGLFGLFVGVFIVAVFRTRSAEGEKQASADATTTLATTLKIRPNQFWQDLRASPRGQCLVAAIAVVAIGHNLYGALFSVHTSSAGRTILASVATLLIFNVENCFSSLWSVPSLSFKYDITETHFWFLLAGYVATLLGTLWFFDLFIPLPWRVKDVGHAVAAKGAEEESGGESDGADDHDHAGRDDGRERRRGNSMILGGGPAQSPCEGQGAVLV